MERKLRHGSCDAHMSSPHFSRLIAITDGLKGEHEPKSFPAEWRDSPLEWLRIGLPSRTKGKVGEVIVERWLRSEGFSVRPPGDTEADLVVNSTRVEVKMSLLWATGIYKFQQLRDQNYSLLLCLGLSPFEAHCWVLPKTLLLARVIGRGRGQHGGASASETAWLQVDPSAPEDWMQPRSGRLDEAIEILRQATT